MSWTQIFFLCIAVGIGIIGIGYYFQWKSQAIEKWPSTYGTVISAEIEKKTSTERTSGKNVNPTSRTTVTYYPLIKYEYTVFDTKYTSDKISIDVSGSSKPEYLKPVLDKYLPGQKVRVFYDPENPSDAVLEKVSGMGIIFYFVGVIWLTVWTVVAAISYTVQKFVK